MAQFKSLTDGRIVTASGDEAVARFQSDPEFAPYEPEPEPSDGLDKLNLADLKAYAEEHGVELGDAKKKAEIVAAIRAHIDAQGDDEDDSDEDDA